ncbi:MAG: LLM class flavin-dependent oxidoreductase [Pseudorhodoplanes sp.]
MKFGLFLPFHRLDRSVSQKEVYDQTMECVTFAEEAGFQSVWFPEHHLIEYIACPSPLMFIAAAAQRTTRIRLGTAIIVAPYYNPLRLAGEIGMADILSNGRLDIGFGRGAFFYEFDRFGIDEKIGAARLRENLEAVEGLIKNQDFEYHGSTVNFPKSTAVPKPLQRPMPPTWLAARSPDSIRWGIERGYNQLMTPWRESFERVEYLYNIREKIIEEVKPPVRPKLAMSRMTFVGRTDGEALDAMTDIQVHHRIWTRLFTGKEDVTAGFVKPDPVDDEYSNEKLFNNLVAGDPARCIAELKKYEKIGVDEFILYPGITLSHKQTMKSLYRFVEEVKPEFSERATQVFA